MVGWAALADLVPLYPLYALLFADAGLSTGEITALFALWSAVGIAAEVPAGGLADRFSRRSCLVVASVLQGGAYATWVLLPTRPGFALGFVLWGLGGSLMSGALEALLYDGLAEGGAEDRFGTVLGQVRAAGLLAQVVASVAAVGLYSAGGYPLVGWVSVACCLAAAGVAARLPEPARSGGGAAEDAPGSYAATLRAGLHEAATRPVVRRALVAVAALTAFDTLEEYFGLLARDWGVSTALTPLAVLGIPVVGALGAAAGGPARRLPAAALAVLLALGTAALAAGDLLHAPVGLVGVTAFYGLYRLVLVVADTRLQERIEGSARATVTSVAALGTDLLSFGIYAAWVLGEVALVAGLLAALALALPVLLRTPAARRR